MLINLILAYFFTQYSIDSTLSGCEIAAIFITNTRFYVRYFCARSIFNSAVFKFGHFTACKNNSSWSSNIYASVHGGWTFGKCRRAWCSNVAFQFCIVDTKFYKLGDFISVKKTYLNCSTISPIPESVFGGDVVVEALVGLGVVVVLLGLGFGRLVVFLFWVLGAAGFLQFNGVNISKIGYQNTLQIKWEWL